MQPVIGEFGATNDIDTFLNQQMLASPQFDPLTLPIDFLDQILSSVAPFDAAFPWEDDRLTPQLEEQSTAVLDSKLRQHQISHAGNHNDVVDGNAFNSANLMQANDLSVEALFDGFTGSLGHVTNQVQHFRHPQNFGAGAADTPPVAATVINQPGVSGTSGGGAGGQPRQRVRARRGQATDPHSIAERLRRERIAERMKGLQELVPNANKTDKASMLDEIIDYVKFLQLQVKVLSTSRLGGASAAVPSVADLSSQGRRGNGTQTALTSKNNDGMTTVTEHQVAKLMEEDMGSAMQYLQGKGLCLMPISLANTISAVTRNPISAARGPASPSMSSVVTVGESSLKE